MKYIINISLLALTLVLAGAACQKKVTNTQPAGVELQVIEENAFGALSDLTQTPQTASVGASASDANRSAASSAPSTDLKVAPLLNTSYTYVFNGTPLSLTETSVNIFERTTGEVFDLPSSLANVSGMGVMSFGRLSNPTIGNISVRSGDELWYVDATNGTISMYLDTSVPQLVPLSDSQVIKNNADSKTAITIANSFLADRGIDTAPYSSPVVVSASGITGAGTADSLTSSMKVASPQAAMVQVLYPLVVHGLAVVQANGEPAGLFVTVEPTSETITSLYGLSSLRFTQSAYSGITDWTVVQKIAEQGGLYRYGLVTEGAKKTTINLGTPDRVLMISYLYDGSRSREIYVPALRFGLVNSPDAYAKYVVVSLAKDVPTDTPIDIIQPTSEPADGL